jgi:uncharacterized membrane protein YfcA
MEYFYLFAAGILGGFFAGLLGIGGGIIYVAILPFALETYGIDDIDLVSSVISNSILATFFAAAMSLYRHYRNDNFHYKESLYIGIPGAISIILIYRFVVESGSYDFLYFNLFIIVILIFMLVRHFTMNRNISLEEKNVASYNFPLIGISGGTLAALSGLGGGAIVVPLLLTITKMDIKKASSISMGFILVSSFFLSCYNLLKFVDGGSRVIIPGVIIPLIAGVIIAAPFGVNTAKRISSKLLTFIFITFVILVMISRILDII